MSEGAKGPLVERYAMFLEALEVLGRQPDDRRPEHSLAGISWNHTSKPLMTLLSLWRTSPSRRKASRMSAVDKRPSWSLNVRISRPPSNPRIRFTNAVRLSPTSINGDWVRMASAFRCARMSRGLEPNGSPTFTHSPVSAW